jgi:lysophospholipase L1-like esterase
MPNHSFKPKNQNTEKRAISVSEKSAKGQLFCFGTNKKMAKGIQIDHSLVYNPSVGYGFDFDTAQNAQLKNTSFVAEKSTYFSVQVPEGNYSIRVSMGSNDKETKVTIKAESRRLMLDQLSIKKGEQVTKTFNVNIRNPKIDNTSSMTLREREKADLNWDNKLTLEFLGSVAIQKIEIIPISNLTTVFLAGDSTVTDQDIEPWASWGQFITNYFNDQIVVANYAVSGSALSSFKASGRLKKILSLIKPGDYLIVEFAHNDEKIKGEGNGAWGSYSNLLDEFIQAARDKGAIPILSTPTQRRAFNTDGTLKQTHGEFPDAMRAVAKKTNTPLIDVTELTTQLYESWGNESSKKAFVHYSANTFLGQEKALEDNTHFNSFGANEVALCVIKGIRDLEIPLKNFIKKQIKTYNPRTPNSFPNWTLPMSPRFETSKPDGN